MDAPAMWLRAISISGPHLDIKHFISGWSLPAMLPDTALLQSPVSQPAFHGDPSIGTQMGLQQPQGEMLTPTPPCSHGTHL